MNQIMSPSAVQENAGMTDGQIEKAVDKLRAKLRKHRTEFPTDASQQAVTAKNFGDDLLAVVRRNVERFSNMTMITRLVKVNRSRTLEQAIAATGRRQYVDSAVVAIMPQGDGEEAEVFFFKPDKSAYDENGLISDALENQFKSRNLVPADPYSLSAVNEADSAFAEKYPNATYCKDTDGKLCYVAFGRWSDDERGVVVYRGGNGLSDGWWLAGLAKK